MSNQSARGELRIGCAGWTLQRDAQSLFGEGESHLTRYGTRLNAVEINSSFYRPHSHATYAKWAASAPRDFHFSVKLPKAITHELRLQQCATLLDSFFNDVGGLGTKLGCVLVQLPPSFTFDSRLTRDFLSELAARWAGDISIEPRHASWFEDEAHGLLQEFRIARVLADPVRHAAGAMPGGASHLVYLRLHGSPRMYYSSYEDRVIETLAARIEMALTGGVNIWCIFDNTASGAATHNALALQARFTKEPA
ncbi:MAG: DUF72 domain-containing protein [Pseudomonadota bacterium]